MDTSTYWHSSYLQKLPVLHFLSLNSYNLTMGCEQSADSIFFPVCKFVACWNAQRFHTVCAVFVRNLQLERLCSRDPQSSWPRAAFGCVLPHGVLVYLPTLLWVFSAQLAASLLCITTLLAITTQSPAKPRHDDHDNTLSCERRERCWKPAHNMPPFFSRMLAYSSLLEKRNLFCAWMWKEGTVPST